LKNNNGDGGWVYVEWILNFMAMMMMMSSYPSSADHMDVMIIIISRMGHGTWEDAVDFESA
jgi:hypothetical protein